MEENPRAAQTETRLPITCILPPQLFFQCSQMPKLIQKKTKKIITSALPRLIKEWMKTQWSLNFGWRAKRELKRDATGSLWFIQSKRRVKGLSIYIYHIAFFLLSNHQPKKSLNNNGKQRYNKDSETQAIRGIQPPAHWPRSVNPLTQAAARMSERRR